MLSVFYWDPDPKIFTVPLINFPILWYGVCFAVGFWLAFLLFIRILARYLDLVAKKRGHFAELKKQAQSIGDRFTVYIVIGTILGARLGHFLFYESPSVYLSDPLEFFRFRNGGLASHGAVLGIIIAVIFFSYRIRKTHPDLTWIRLLDLISSPSALGCACIRVGNFFNQEILGTPSTLPWAVVFGHPADGTLPLPRHPAQLYEAIWYFALSFFLWKLTYKPSFLLAKGKLIGLFFILAFGFRFLIESIKTEQSHIFASHYLTMGQLLSIPVILAGFLFYYYSARHRS